ncbi:MAG: hypothetical protein JXA45_06705 [Methanomassiliicoccales archaeon]|nr:hypothetical protein [Methanomassiliicoccales archaeon]
MELDGDREMHMETHRALDELGKFSLHMKVDFGKGTPAEKAVSFVEDLLLRTTDSCLNHGADMVGHVKALMMVDEASTVVFSLIHQRMGVNITKRVNSNVIESAEVIVHVIVHGLWDPDVRELALEVLDEVANEHDVRFDIIKGYKGLRKSAAPP